VDESVATTAEEEQKTAQVEEVDQHPQIQDGKKEKKFCYWLVLVHLY